MVKEIKKKRYWLKGGIIGIFIDIILVLLYFLGIILQSTIIFLNLNNLNVYLNFVMVPVYEFFMYSSYFCPELGIDTNCGSPILAILFAILIPIIIYFIIGAIIGRLYGIIKNRKN